MQKIIERAKRAHSLFMSIEISDIYIIYIYIYISSRSSRFVYPFSPYTQEALLKIILIVYLGYPGIVMFATVRVFKVSTRMCTIKKRKAS